MSLRVLPLDAAAPRYDLVVIGAGPAGLSAACAASGLGLSTAILDEKAGPGGAVHRGVGAAIAPAGATSAEGRRLAADFARADADALFETSTFSVANTGDRRFELGASQGGAARSIEAGSVVVAVGATERSFPIPGWTLPGVMTAGAAQGLWKSAGVVPKGRVVLAGAGPLLALVAAQLVEAGVDVARVLVTAPRPRVRDAAPQFARFALSRLALEALDVVRRLPFGRLRFGVSALRAEGGETLEEVVWTRDGRVERARADHLLLHAGVVPNVALAMAAGCPHRWSEEQRAFHPVRDAWLAAPDGLAIAGDCGGIVGARASALEGRIAAIGCARRLGRISSAEASACAAADRRRRARILESRRFLDALSRPPDVRSIPDEVVVCRCEETTAGAIRAAVAHGARGPNQAKAFTRCGMGACRGRLCGLTLAELVAAALDRSPEETGHPRMRVPTQPITLRELAALPRSEAARAAVHRDEQA